MNKGIAIAGNMIVDLVKMIDRYPGKSELTVIRDIWRSTGGAVCNTIMDLARLDKKLPLHAIGHVGEDAEGDFLLSELERYPNINTGRVKRGGSTAFTDAMTEIDSKMRTFFTYRGSDDMLCEEDLELDSLETGILHIGYILLLAHFDEEDAEYGTRMARALCNAQKQGIITSIDVVSETGNRFMQKVPPALKYSDYCVINEFEASMVTGIQMRKASGELLFSHAEEALKKLKEMGVSRWAVVHTPEAAFGMDERGHYVAKPCLALPEGFIKGTTGAGDAFCAGVLYSAHEGGDLDQALDCGMATAAASLSQGDANSGVESWDKVKKLLDLPRQAMV